MPERTIQQSRYTLSKMSIVACIVIITGLIVSMQGVINIYHLARIRSSYRESEIKRGRYIECDISRGHLVGLYYTELNGETMFSPYGVINTDTNTLTCLVAVNDGMNYYVSLKLSGEYQEEVAKIIQSDTETLHLIGKFKKKTPLLLYNKIALCLGIDDESVIKSMVSNQYLIKPVNPKMEKSILFIGLLLLVGGIFGLYVTVEKEDVESL